MGVAVYPALAGYLAVWRAILRGCRRFCVWGVGADVMDGE